MWSRASDRCVVVAAMVVGGGLAGIGVAGPASATVLADQYVEVPQCQPNTTQDCPQMPEVHFIVPGGARVQASYTANANHCSDIRVRFLKNTSSMGFYPASDWLQAGPGQTVTTGYIDLSDGDQTLKVQAQGVPGGCNVGHIDAWGGMVHVESEVIPTEAPSGPTFDPFPFGRGIPDDLGIH